MKKSPIGVITLQLSRSESHLVFSQSPCALCRKCFSLSHGNLLLLLLYGNIIHLFTATDKEAVEGSNFYFHVRNNEYCFAILLGPMLLILTN